MHILIEESHKLAEQLRVLLQSSLLVCEPTSFTAQNWLDAVFCSLVRNPMGPATFTDYRNNGRRDRTPQQRRQQLMPPSICSARHRFSAGGNTMQNC